MVNQFLLHIGETPAALLEFCRQQQIVPEAYCPIAHGDALKVEGLARTAARLGVTVPQLCIRYTLQLGAVSLPKSLNPDHIRSNARLDFVIPPEDMAALQAIGKDYSKP